MKIAAILGVLLIVLGVVSLVYQGISYTTRDEIVDLGPIEATKKETKTVPLPPILGILSLAGGIVLIAVAARRS